MADFLDDLGKIISDGVDVVAKKTGEVADVVVKKTEQTFGVQKLKSQICIMEKNNDRDLKDIGKMIYERYQKGEVLDEQFVELCEVIAERNETIAKYKEEIAELKGKEVCSNCGAYMDDDATFCSKCGAKVE